MARNISLVKYWTSSTSLETDTWQIINNADTVLEMKIALPLQDTFGEFVWIFFLGGGWGAQLVTTVKSKGQY